MAEGLKLVPVDIETVEPGVMLYDKDGVAIGVVVVRPLSTRRLYERVLDNGEYKDRFAYRRRNLYRIAKQKGVYVKA